MKKENFIQLLSSKEYKKAQSVLTQNNAIDNAKLLESLDPKDCAFAFRLIPKDEASKVFSCMSSSMQAYLVDLFTQSELKEVIDSLYMDDTVDLLEDLPANLVKRILASVDPQKRNIINKLCKYPEDSAGSIMTIEYVSLRKEMTVQEALDHIKATGIHKETIYTCYVLENKKLLGIVSAKSLITSNRDTKIEKLMNKNIISVQTHTDQEEVAKLFRKYDLIAMPVLDSENCFVGIVTFDDVMDVMIDETNEDISKMAAIEPNEKGYFETTVWQHAKHRIMWLLILMFSATITGSIITRYENAFQAVPLLVSFIPMLMDTGGNCGSQSSTLIIRGLALGDIKFKDLFRVIFKEFRISLIVGAILAVANGLRIFIQYQNPQIAIVVALSLAVVVILSKFIGCVLPLFANKVGLDPAIMASPLITTIVDTCSILVYFNIAVHIFNIYL
ncbi:magnesium transporter [Firmicutes bacterium AM41-11]|nr:magnesium transporter [Firmicutes bacterium AM41-11]